LLLAKVIQGHKVIVSIVMDYSLRSRLPRAAVHGCFFLIPRHYAGNCTWVHWLYHSGYSQSVPADGFSRQVRPCFHRSS